jgi:Peptidase family M28/PA domain
VVSSRRPLRACRPRLGTATAPGVLAAVAAVLLSGACTGSQPPMAGQPDARTVADSITEEGLRARLAELSQVTGGSDRFRSVGSRGYAEAANLVERELAASGWSVAAQTYDDVTFVDDGGSSLEVGDRVFAVEDVRPLMFAPAGDASGVVFAIGPEAAESTGTGCSVGDYRAIPADAIVLAGQGDCLRRDQVIAAQQAGAAAFVAVPTGASPDIVLRPTLLDPRGLTIPAASVSRDVAKALVAAASGGVTARLVTNAHVEQVPTRTVIAELRGSRGGEVVMLGAHLDSVIDGPGINDNGSGVAALLEIARALGGTRPQATVRMAFWSGEELGLHGSLRYVASLSPQQKESILVYANVDMIASPNGFAGVYDEPDAPAGSPIAARLLGEAVTRNGGTPVSVDLHGGSDHYGFGEAGVATAGVFSGFVAPVSAEQSAVSGARAGRPADDCYHQPCDDLTNVDLGLARILAAGLADFTVQVATNPELLQE